MAQPLTNGLDGPTTDTVHGSSAVPNPIADPVPRNRCGVVWASLVAAVLALWPAGGAAEERPSGDQGGPRMVIDEPVPVSNQFPLGVSFLALEPASAFVLPKAEWRFQATGSWSNTFAASNVIRRALERRESRLPVTDAELRALAATAPNGNGFFADAELFTTTFSLQRGMGRRVEIGFSLPAISFDGGSLDSAIEGLHSALGFDQDGRKGVPRDSFRVYSLSSASELSLQEPPALELGDVALDAKIRLGATGAGGGHRALRLELKLPTGDETRLAGTGSADFGAQFLYSRSFRHSSVHGAVGIAFLGPNRSLGTGDQTVWSVSASAQRQIADRLWVVGQALVSESPLRGLGMRELTKSVLQWTLALKSQVREDAVLSVGFTENQGYFDNSSDVGLHLGLTWIFGQGSAALQ